MILLLDVKGGLLGSPFFDAWKDRYSHVTCKFDPLTIANY